MNSFSLGIASDGTGAMLQGHYITIGSGGSKNENASRKKYEAIHQLRKYVLYFVPRSKVRASSWRAGQSD